MLRKRACLLAILLLFGCFIKLVQAEELGDWRLVARELSQDRPLDRLCEIYSPPDGVQMRLLNVASSSVAGAFRGEARIDLILPETLFDADRAIEGAVFEVPNHARWSDVRVTWRARDGEGGSLSANLGVPIDSILPALARGRSLEVIIGSEQLSVSLAGSYKAIVAYEGCLAEVMAR